MLTKPTGAELAGSDGAVCRVLPNGKRVHVRTANERVRTAERQCACRSNGTTEFVKKGCVQVISAICTCASQKKCYRLDSAANGSVKRLSASVRAILCVGSSDLSARDDEVIIIRQRQWQGAMMLQCDSIQALQPPEYVSTALGVLMAVSSGTSVAAVQVEPFGAVRTSDRWMC